MSIKAKYNPVDDRMELLIDLDGEEPVLLVFTRPLWLRVLRRLRTALQSSDVNCVDDLNKAPNKRNQNKQDFSVFSPVTVSGFRLINGKEKGWSLFFLSPERKLRLALSPSGLKQCEELLFLQAERGGWDPLAALNRLRADELAKDALLKAVTKRSSD